MEPAAPAADPAAAVAAEPAAQTPEAQPACAPEQSDTPTPAEPDPATAQAAAEPVEAHCSQNAGNQQYQDPFAGAEAPGKGGNGGSSQGGSQGAGGSTSQDTGTTTSGDPVASQGTVAGDGTGTTTESAGPSLPNTGLGLGGLLAVGMPLLAGGIALRLRLA